MTEVLVFQKENRSYGLQWIGCWGEPRSPMSCSGTTHRRRKRIASEKHRIVCWKLLLSIILKRDMRSLNIHEGDGSTIKHCHQLAEL